MTAIRHFTIADAHAFAERACLAAGANRAAARSLADATVAAETWGRASVGFSHLPDYLAALRDGTIEGDADPDISFPRPALVRVDAKGGIGQLGFDRALSELQGRARSYGVATLLQHNSYTVGELGYYVRRLAQSGLVALAATNSYPLVTPPGAKRPLYGTNPLAFAAPATGGEAIVVDQSSSETALVNVRAAAASGTPLPVGWALDGNGAPTTDPVAALAGSLLPFGGTRGANLALIVEILAAAMTGGEWSADAPRPEDADGPCNFGLFVLAIDPASCGEPFVERLGRHLTDLRDLGAYVPGLGRRAAEARAAREGISLPVALVERIASLGGPDA